MMNFDSMKSLKKESIRVKGFFSPIHGFKILEKDTHIDQFKDLMSYSMMIY